MRADICISVSKTVEAATEDEILERRERIINDLKREGWSVDEIDIDWSEARGRHQG